MTKRLLSVGVALALTIGIAACGSSSSSSSSTSANTPLVGAGSTLVAPLMSKWQSDYASKTKETVTYGAIGSGGGISQITAARSISVPPTRRLLPNSSAKQRKSSRSPGR